MIYTKNTKKAINIAYSAHMGQEDKKYSILDELSKSNGYEIALMTTFNFVPMIAPAFLLFLLLTTVTLFHLFLILYT